MNVLWIPIFSMRSHETGQYSILKDGNFQLTMARVLASDFDRVFVAIPENTSDFNALLERFKGLERVYFVEMKYGANAVATRDLFWISNTELLGSLERYAELMISDITGYPGSLPVVYNFNITKLPELDRPYVDRFFETDLKSIEKSAFTTVLNPRQREYILEVRPDLLDKVIVNTKCAHADLLPKTKVWPVMANTTIFWPFRISDKAYKWAEFCEAFEAQGLHDDGCRVIVTDPNDTLKDPPSWVIVQKPSKEEYYQLLSAEPIVVMLDDIDTVLHPGTIEFFYYGCPVITFKSNLIQNPNVISNLGELRTSLERLEYNAAPENLDSFVYKHGELDMYYNTEFVNVRKN